MIDFHRSLKIEVFNGYCSCRSIKADINDIVFSVCEGHSLDFFAVAHHQRELSVIRRVHQSRGWAGSRPIKLGEFLPYGDRERGELA